MAGGEPENMPKFTGLAKYFNSYTVIGRRNVVLAVYGSLFLGYLFFKLKPSKKQ